MNFVEFPAEHVVKTAAEAWERDGTPLPEPAARCIASWWQSPSNGLAAFSTAGIVSRAVVDGAEATLTDVVERMPDTHDSAWEGENANRRELSALVAYLTDSQHVETVNCACCGYPIMGLAGDACRSCGDDEHDPAETWHCHTGHCDGSGCTYPGECEGAERPASI
jgi:hypothetical protein